MVFLFATRWNHWKVCFHHPVLRHYLIAINGGKEPHLRFYKSAACCPRSLVPFKARATLPYKRVGFTVTAKQRQTSIANVYSITYNTLVWISRGRVWEQKRAQEREPTFQPPAQGLKSLATIPECSFHVYHTDYCSSVSVFSFRF